MSEFEPVSRMVGIVGYALSAANLALWFWLILRAKRAREYLHFASELALFATGIVFFLALFTSVAAPWEYRVPAVMWVRWTGFALGILFSVHSGVALATRERADG